MNETDTKTAGEPGTGRELDQRIATEVMGYVVAPENDGDFDFVRGVERGEAPRWGHAWPLEDFSENMAHAWYVVERMVALGWYSYVCVRDGIAMVVFCWPMDTRETVGQAPTVPLAICRAALKAVKL